MSVEQEISYENKTLLSSIIKPDIDPTIVKNVWVTGGIDGSDIGDCVLDFQVYCDPSDDHGAVVFINPFTHEKESHRISAAENVLYALDIKISEGKPGKLTWTHVPGLKIKRKEK
jgi:hypothetical protein